MSAMVSRRAAFELLPDVLVRVVLTGELPPGARAVDRRPLDRHESPFESAPDLPPHPIRGRGLRSGGGSRAARRVVA